MSGLPNPGSAAAVADGCSCPVMDNNRGMHAPRPPDGWFVTQGCEVHAPLPPECEQCGSTEWYEKTHEYESGREFTMTFCSGCNMEG